MSPSAVSAVGQRQLSEFVADKMGLHFPHERWPDLLRGLAGAAAEFGFDNVAACTGWLMAEPLTKAQLQTLASHLTIGETYFFREKRTFEVLARQVLPGLIHSRRSHERRLRLWSAGCCTGEEAYSLAILLEQLIPDLADWQVTILATDINPHFLRKAATGTYGEWSFRGAPAGLKEQYFHQGEAGRHVVAPRIKAMVTFAHLNLVDDVYPAVTTNTNAMDLILCRNVLMYFDPAQTRRVVDKLHRALLEDGWMAVSPCEVSADVFPQFAMRTFPGATLFQKSAPAADPDGCRIAAAPESKPPGADAGWSPEPAGNPAAGERVMTHLPDRPRHVPPPPESPPPVAPLATPSALAMSLYEQGRYAAAADALLALADGSTPDPAVYSPLARALANQGKLAEALIWCDRWIAADKVAAAGHYLRAVILLEQGDPAQARGSLERAVYCHPDFVLAHFALGNLARRGGRNREADRHFANALHLLARLPPSVVLPESDGLTAARLIEIITALTGLEDAS